MSTDQSPAPGSIESPKHSRRGLGLAGIALLCIGVAIVFTGITSREKGNAELRSWTDAQAIPTVAVALPGSKPLAASIDLPGRLEAFNRAPIYARVSGYVKSWSADIGAQVKAGQVIAEIDAPEVDQQLLQAKADLSSQQSSARLSEATLNRRKQLLASNFVSAQEIDERSADLANKRAAVNSGQANVERLEALAGYKKVTVPFDGVVTARDTDVGALITGGTGTGPAMFVISDIRKLRVYVNVPQSYVPAIRIGAKALITLPERPNRSYPATVEASSQAVDVSTGTTRMQLALDNAGGELMPGSYANVRMNLTRDAVPLSVPASALMFNQNGLRVATVGPDDRVVLKTVTIARDLGRDIELGSGLAASDRIIVAPPDGIAEGDQVRVVDSSPPAPKPATASQKQDVKG